MDPQGLVYDMQANFIGTANLEDLEESGAEQDESQENAWNMNKMAYVYMFSRHGARAQ